jgi:hypothetical protein
MSTDVQLDNFFKSEAKFIQSLSVMGNHPWPKSMLPKVIADLEGWRRASIAMGIEEDKATDLSAENKAQLAASRATVKTMIDRTIEKVKAQL